MARLWMAMIGCIGVTGGCQTNQTSSQPPENATLEAELIDDPLELDVATTTSPQTWLSPAENADSPAELITARAAAMRVAAMPRVPDPRTRMEVLLHAALYRAAMNSNVAGFTSHFLLEPAPEAEVASISIEPTEFRLRVLAALDRPIVTVAWNPQPGDRSERTFPGTPELATRLSIRIHERINDEATIMGEVGDHTTNVGSSRQGVTATWDGERWNIERDRVRLVW